MPGKTKAGDSDTIGRYRCPLCREMVGNTEFHHWDYERDIGVKLCEPCHEKVHGGSDGRVSIQQNRAEYHGLEGWHDFAIKNLIEHDIENSPGDELPEPIGTVTIVGNSEEAQLAHELYQQERKRRWREYKRRLRERYNLPPDELIEATSGVWGEHPPSSFDCWLKCGEPISKATGHYRRMDHAEVIERYLHTDS